MPTYDPDFAVTVVQKPHPPLSIFHSLFLISSAAWESISSLSAPPVFSDVECVEQRNKLRKLQTNDDPGHPCLLRRQKNSYETAGGERKVKERTACAWRKRCKSLPPPLPHRRLEEGGAQPPPPKPTLFHFFFPLPPPSTPGRHRSWPPTPKEISPSSAAAPEVGRRIMCVYVRTDMKHCAQTTPPHSRNAEEEEEDALESCPVPGGINFPGASS